LGFAQVPGKEKGWLAVHSILGAVCGLLKGGSGEKESIREEKGTGGWWGGKDRRVRV